MSDTPRTDDRIVYGTLSGDDSIGAPWVNAPFARQLERELNAANEMIKRMDKAAEFMVCEDDPFARLKRWHKAKEGKL